MSKIGNLKAAVGLFSTAKSNGPISFLQKTFCDGLSKYGKSVNGWSTVVDLVIKYGNIVKMCRFPSHPHIGVRSTELASMSELGLEFVLTLSLFLVVVPLVDQGLRRRDFSLIGA